MHKPILTVNNLTKIYHPSWLARWRGQPSFTAVNNVSFSLPEGEVLGLLGPNGAGKTTITQMLLSTLTPTSGKINYFGKDFYKDRSNVLRQVSFASAYIRLPGRLTVQENLDLFGKLYGMSASDRQTQIERFLKFFDMWHLKYRETSGLSAGQMTRIMLCKAFFTRPRILLLDEPTASLDPDVAHDTLKFVQERQKQDGVSILFTSHNMEEVVLLCNRVLVLQHGEIIADDSPSRLASTVSNTQILLIMNDANLEKACAYGREKNLNCYATDNLFTINVDEHAIGSTLSALGVAGISYEHISINKPTLKDYFLQIAKASRTTKQE